MKIGKIEKILCLMALSLCLWLGAAGRAEAAGTVLENDKFKLELVNEYSEVHLTDKTTGNVWSSSMSDPQFDISKVSGRWKDRMQSLFTLNVTDLRIGVGSVSNHNLSGSEYTAVPYETDYGLGVEYDMKAAGVKISIEFALTLDGFSIRIPSEKVEKYGNFSAVSVDLMPFFAGAVDNQDGYLFYPDGSGAILNFNDPAHVGESAVTYTVYGDIQNNQNLKGRFEQVEASVLLPVFGANYGEKGFVAYITSGEETSRITVNPSGNIVKASYIYPTFLFRRGFDDPRVTNQSVSRYDDEQLTTVYEIHYEILPEGKTTYADMAVAYRDYLTENGLLANDSKEELKLSVDLFMGIN